MLAYLLTKDLDSKHVGEPALFHGLGGRLSDTHITLFFFFVLPPVTLGSPDDGTSADEQAFSFSHGGSVEVELQPTQHHASVYEPEWPATAYPPSPSAAAQQQGAYPPPHQSPPMYSNTRGLAAPAVRTPPIPIAVWGGVANMVVCRTCVPQPRDTFGAPSTHSTNGSADDYNPFQEERF